MSHLSTIKQDLNAFRAKSGWSIPKISAKTGVPQRTIEAWLAGDRTPPSYVERLVIEKAYRELELELNPVPSEDIHRTFYSLLTVTFEFDPRRFATVSDAFYAIGISADERNLGRYDTLEQAQSALNRSGVSLSIYNPHLARATCAYIREDDFSFEDGDWTFCDGGEIIEGRFDDRDATSPAVTHDYEQLAIATKSPYGETGIIVRYDGDLFFVAVEQPKNLYERVTLPTLDGWWSTIEHNYVYDSIDPDSDRKYRLEGDKHLLSSAEVISKFN